MLINRWFHTPKLHVPDPMRKRNRPGWNCFMTLSTSRPSSNWAMA